MFAFTLEIKRLIFACNTRRILYDVSVVQDVILADIEKISDRLTSLEGKYVNVYKKMLQAEKCKTSQQRTSDFYWYNVFGICCMVFS